MDLAVDQSDGLAVVAASGDINAATCAKLEETLVGLIEGGAGRIVLDLADTRYISSAGLRVLLVAAKRLSAGGGGSAGFALSRPSASVRQLLEITGFSGIIPVHDDLSAAKRAVGGGGG